ncbi:hypothetical protein AKO1_002372 [Acrasis kona]|uniref:Uncharacterized protein n=1 Tax=Acrasis kona TaxID=1008807 RepID=A0AAW2ZPE6_9EUKA
MTSDERPTEEQILQNRNLYIQNAMQRVASMALERRQRSLQLISQNKDAFQNLLVVIQSPEENAVISPIHNSTRTLLIVLSLLFTQGQQKDFSSISQHYDVKEIDVALSRINFEEITNHCYDQIHPYFNEGLYPEMEPQKMSQLSPIHDGLFQFVDSAFSFIKIKYA